jgi:hypothetical protein
MRASQLGNVGYAAHRDKEQIMRSSARSFLNNPNMMRINPNFSRDNMHQ